MDIPEQVKNKIDAVFDDMVVDGIIATVKGEKIDENILNNVNKYPLIIKNSSIVEDENDDLNYCVSLRYLFPYTLVINNSSGTSKTQTDILRLREKILNVFRKIAIRGKYKDNPDNYFPPNVWISQKGGRDYRVKTEKDKIFLDIIIEARMELFENDLE